MTNLVQFPGLGLEFNITNVAFTFFGLEIYWYGVLIATGMMLAVLFAIKHAVSAGIDPDRMLDVVLIGAICAILAGRAYFMIFIDDSSAGILEFFNIRAGGIGIYGAIIGAFISAFFLCKLRKVPVLPLFDLAGIGFLIGQAMGRWGNFFNQEAFGINTTLPWGMYSNSTAYYLQSKQAELAQMRIFVDPSLPVHPTFLYESLWCLLGFAIFALYYKKRKFNGEIFLLYTVWYGFGRFWIEGLRTDSLMLTEGVRVSQLLAALFVLAGVCLLILGYLRSRGKPLVVPEIPPRTAKVIVDGRKEPVIISWAVEQKTKNPSKNELRQMALDQVEKEETEAREALELAANGKGKRAKRAARKIASQEITGDEETDTVNLDSKSKKDDKKVSSKKDAKKE